MTFIEVANSAFIHLLRYLETSFDILCFALIAKITYSVVIHQILKQGLSKVFCMLLSCGLKSTINLTITANSRDIALQTVASVDYTGTLDLRR